VPGAGHEKKMKKNGLYQLIDFSNQVWEKINNHTDSRVSVVVFFKNDKEICRWVNGHEI
jgi:hypothetical protein